MIIIIFSDYVSPACVPLGVADRNTIPEARMTASTFHDSHYHPSYGRLNGKRGNGGWCTKTPSDRTDYLQVDMGAVSSVCAVATQGIQNSNSNSNLYFDTVKKFIRVWYNIQLHNNN